MTGGTGFVGQNWLTYVKSFFPTWQNILLNRNNINRNNLEEFFVNIDVLLHFAGKAHDIRGTSNSNEFYETNYNLTVKLYDEFLESNARIFIFIS
jgi:nucleoside-diphosphate-sugar epimerase